MKSFSLAVCSLQCPGAVGSTQRLWQPAAPCRTFQQQYCPWMCLELLLVILCILNIQSKQRTQCRYIYDIIYIIYINICIYVCKTATTPLVFHLLSALVQCGAPILAPSGERTGDGWTKWAGFMDIHTSSPQNTRTSFLSWLFKSPSSLVQSLLTLFPQQSHRLPSPLSPPSSSCTPFPITRESWLG